MTKIAIKDVRDAMVSDYDKYHMIVECWDDQQIEDAIGLSSTVKGALRKLAKHMDAWNGAAMDAEANLHKIDANPAAIGEDLSWVEQMQDTPKLNFNDDAQHEIDSAHMGDDTDHDEPATDEAATEEPTLIDFRMEGYIKGNYAYSTGEFQGKTRWFDTRKTKVVEGCALSDPLGEAPADSQLGWLTVSLTAKEAKKRKMVA